MALFCNGSGKVIKKAFPVKNNPEGILFLMDAVDKICRKHNILRKHVFFGGEDCGSFSKNFIYALRDEGFIVIGVNAKDAKTQRSNMQASTDALDLLGIAKLLLNRQGSLAGGEPGDLLALRTLTRYRKTQVKQCTATKNRIHQIVDQLFPGFLNEKLSGITPFSETSMYLMQNNFSATRIAKKQDQALLRQLKAHGQKNPTKALAKLKAYAKQVLTTPHELTGMLQSSLAGEVRLLTCLNDNIELGVREVAQQLSKTPGAMLTTCRGIAIVLSAGVAAEIGNVHSQNCLRQLTSYAGIVPRVKQTGGPEKAAKTSRMSRRCNHILKDYIVQCGNHIGIHGPADLMEDHRRRTANKQHADFGMARRFLRLSMKLMRTTDCYLPARLRTHATKEELASYYLKLWPKLLLKWCAVGAEQVAFAPENPLGKWRNCIQEIYDIKLPLPRKK